jgi:glycosyltransferase involved in cell wall biosynthesis
MKVLAIADTTDVRCGWGRYAFEVVNGFQKQGIDCVILTQVSSQTKRQSPLPTEHAVLLPFSKFNIIKNILLVRKYITDDVTVIHSFDAWPFAIYAFFANIGKGKPLFMTGVGTYSIPPDNKSLKARLMQLAYARAKEVFCISKYTRDFIRSRVKKANLSIVYWGASVLPHLTSAEKEHSRQYFNISPDRSPIILTVGQIKHRKGQFDTLQAVKLLKKKYPTILYIALGSTADTKYAESLKEFAKREDLEENFRIVDNQKTDKELAFFYDLCDLFAMNSNNEGVHYEGFGLVFIEAAQFAKPAVGSRDCGIEDAIVDGETGFLTKQGDHVDIAEKIEKLLTSDIKKFGQAAQTRAKSFSWDKTVKQYIEAYGKFVK